MKHPRGNHSDEAGDVVLVVFLIVFAVTILVPALIYLSDWIF